MSNHFEYSKNLEISRHEDVFKLKFSINTESDQILKEDLRLIIQQNEFLPGTTKPALLSDFLLFFKVADHEHIYQENDIDLIDFKYLSTIEKLARANDFEVAKHDEVSEITDILNQEFSETKKYFSDIETLSLRDYQIQGTNWLLALNKLNHGSILADDMGLGKTIMSIAFINQLLQEKSDRKIIIICPVSVLRNWEKEILKYLKKVRYLRFEGEYKETYFLNTDIVQILISSYTNIANSIKDFKNIHFDLAIFDEAQNLKNYKTKTYKELNRINSKNRVLLSGTPIENNILELWSLGNFAEEGIFPSVREFKKKYSKEVLLDPNSDEVRNLRRDIKHMILRREKEDVLKELPEKILLERSSDMTDEQIKITKEILSDKKTKHIVKFNKLIQAVSHPMLVNKISKAKTSATTNTGIRAIASYDIPLKEDRVQKDYKEDYKEDYRLSSKLSLLAEMISQDHIRKSNTIVFTRFIETQTMIKNLAKKYYKFVEIINGETSIEDRESIVDMTRSADYPCCLILSYRASAVGINLQHFDVVFHYDKWWNPQLEKQAEDRAYRMGRKGDVTVYSLLTNNSIDDHVKNLHTEKKIIVENIVGSMVQDLNEDKNIEKILMDYESEFMKKYYDR